MKRVALAVVSPHRDDAALSLGGFLGTMAGLRVSFRILNCFTISGWAPYRPGLTVDQVTRLRRREDRCFGRRLGHAVTWCDLRGLDAPLRLGESVEILNCSDEIVRPVDIDWLARRLTGNAGTDLVLAPLGLGRHVDHLVARHAALSLRRSHALAFYEDIPYAGTVDDEERSAAVANAGAQLGQMLRPVMIAGGFPEKHSLARVYRSQIGDEEIAEIRLAVSRMGGERLWAGGHAYTRLTSWLGRRAA